MSSSEDSENANASGSEAKPALKEGAEAEGFTREVLKPSRKNPGEAVEKSTGASSEADSSASESSSKTSEPESEKSENDEEAEQSEMEE